MKVNNAAIKGRLSKKLYLQCFMCWCVKRCGLGFLLWVQLRWSWWGRGLSRQLGGLSWEGAALLLPHPSANQPRWAHFQTFSRVLWMEHHWLTLCCYYYSFHLSTRETWRLLNSGFNACLTPDVSGNWRPGPENWNRGGAWWIVAGVLAIIYSVLYDWITAQNKTKCSRAAPKSPWVFLMQHPLFRDKSVLLLKGGNPVLCRNVALASPFFISPFALL